MEESPQETRRRARAVSPGPASAAAPAPGPTGSASALPEMRLTPDEVARVRPARNQIGSSFLPGVSTKVLAGDPSKAGFYTIVLSVPAHTTIAAHSHSDDRIATVVSGTWQFGYGDRFDEHALKAFRSGASIRNPPAQIISRGRVTKRSWSKSPASARPTRATSMPARRPGPPRHAEWWRRVWELWRGQAAARTAVGAEVAACRGTGVRAWSIGRNAAR